VLAFTRASVTQAFEKKQGQKHFAESNHYGFLTFSSSSYFLLQGKHIEHWWRCSNPLLFVRSRLLKTSFFRQVRELLTSLVTYRYELGAHGEQLQVIKGVI
jgi:hypothetical protein